MTKGEIVLINFPFTNLTGGKLRPAIILIETDLDITVSFITSKIDWREETDILLEPNSINGLKRTSLVRTGKIATIDKTLAKGLLGKISGNDQIELDQKLRLSFQLK